MRTIQGRAVVDYAGPGGPPEAACSLTRGSTWSHVGGDVDADRVDARGLIGVGVGWMSLCACECE